MSSLEIRPATLADIARLTEIYADAVTSGTASYELEPPTQAEMTRRFNDMVRGGYPYLVAIREGTIVGYAYANAFRARPAYRFIVENSIYVAPEAKGGGIATALMHALVDQCEQLGFRQILAVIGDGSKSSPSVRLHEKLGFQHAGKLVGTGWKHGRWLDTVLMQLPLNGGNATDPDPQSSPEIRFQEQLRLKTAD